MTAVPHSTGKVVTQASTNLVTQILQSGALVQQGKPGTVTVSQGKIISDTGGQAKVVTQGGQTGVVVTQLPQGAVGKAGQGGAEPMIPWRERSLAKITDHKRTLAPWEQREGSGVR